MSIQKSLFLHGLSKLQVASCSLCDMAAYVVRRSVLIAHAFHIGTVSERGKAALASTNQVNTMSGKITCSELYNLPV